MIYYIGDLHGNLMPIYQLLDTYLESGDSIIQVGDIGIGIAPLKQYKDLNKELQESDIILYVVRGNHDDPKYFDGNHNLSNIKFLEDYSVLDIEGVSHLFMGGAISVDRTSRKLGSDWFEDEKFNLDLDKLKEIKNVERVVAHIVPRFASPWPEFSGIIVEYFKKDSDLKKDIIDEQNKIESAYNKIIKNNKIKHWIFGHYHTSNNIEYEKCKFRCLGISEVINIF